MRLLLLFILVNANLYAQNLVPNPSFEDTVFCPNGVGQFDAVSNWTSHGATPDYENGCATPGSVSVPYNQYGFQPDGSNGKAYFGIFAYDAYIDSAYHYSREAIGINLLTPLNIGQKYFVSFKTNFILKSGVSDIACNKLGALFTTYAFNFSDFSIDPALSAPINNFAHIYSDSIITDTCNWTRIAGSFVADSAYQFITIGNFFRNNMVDTIKYDLGTWAGISYYFIDDICVSTDSLFCFTFNYQSEIQQIGNLSYFPNPCVDYLNIDLEQSEDDFFINIHNITGDIISNFKMGKGITKYKLDTTSFSPGTYILSILSSKQQQTLKLIKL